MARMRIFGYAFIGHYLAIFGPVGLKFFIWTQETNIYQLVLETKIMMLIFHFLGHFWRENGRGHHTRP